MLQVVAGLTVAFVGYVLYEVFKTVSQSSNPPPAAGSGVKHSEPTRQGKPTEQGKPVAAGEAKTAEDAGAEEKGLQLRNPVTGETCSAPTNYRFAKKWVKEALVTEGLLEKIYKNADLDEGASQKVKEAMDKLKVMQKYHG